MSRAPARRTGAPGMKIDFNALKAPVGYVAGAGRGAAGFTTRSDIGPSMPAPDMPRERGGGAPGAAAAGDDDAAPAEGAGPFDAFLGADAGALAGGARDAEDREADAVWDAVDARMDERGRARRERAAAAEEATFRRDNPKISEQFADLKRKLGGLAAAEWEAIPEIGDYTVKKRVTAKLTPAPDSLLVGSGGTALARAAAAGGAETPAGPTDLSAIGAGRSTVVQLKLDRVSDSVSGQTVVDPKGYLTGLKSVAVKSDSEISDIKKARLLLKSVVSTNPRHAPGWIAAARLEEVAGRLAAARELAMKGCELCAGSEDVWLEAARLQTPDNARAVLARGVAALPDAVALWLAAARLEATDGARKRVLLRALERVPGSVRLWKAAVELSDEDDARILLSRAVECCPAHVELWLALARLETKENARKVLNKARQAVPTSAEVWVTAAKLEEAGGDAAMPAKVIPRGVRSLEANGVVIDREWWLKEAEAAEHGAPPMPATCRAIVAEVVGRGVEAEDRLATWLADAEEAARRGAAETARAILAAAAAAFPGQARVWRRAAELEAAHGPPGAQDALLRRAVQFCPAAEVLWLMAAKARWLGGDVAGARAVLEEAFARNPDSEEIWLAAHKVEAEAGEGARARALLAKARAHAPASTPRVWMKSAALERAAGDAAAERELLREGMRRFPDAWKLHLMLGQLEERAAAAAEGGAPDAARAAYAAGVRRCPACAPLWVAAARLEERAGAPGRARALLEQARLKNPGADALWLAAVRAEARAGGVKASEALMARALQECPASGALWAEAVATAARPARKSRSVDALKRCHDDPAVVAAVAGLFWQERKVDKARAWLGKAVALAPEVGDFWALLYKFEAQHGPPGAAAAIAERAAAAAPRYGERWARVAKDPANAGSKIAEVLALVAAELDAAPP
jgi:pre-mRNA-processing factor 6